MYVLDTQKGKVAAKKGVPFSHSICSMPFILAFAFFDAHYM